MNYIDTHFHLDLLPNAIEVAEKIRQAKIYTIAVTNTPSVFHFSHKISQDNPFIRAAVGLHPELALARVNELPLLWDLLEHTRYVGEIGLDYGKLNSSEKVKQRLIFDQIITKCAEKKGKILTVHSRGCAEDVIDTIGPNFPGKVILHWYSGSIRHLERAVANGFYFSVNYQMTLSENGGRVINSIPHDRLLTESDGPFVKIALEHSSPLSMPKILNAISRVYGFPIEHTKALVYRNFEKLLAPI
jgi:TatD DNase family protein